MTTYANIKLSEIYALYGNPFSRGSCKKNFKEKIIRKHFKKLNFEEIIKNENIQQKHNVEDNSQINFLSKNENGLILLRNAFTLHNNTKSKSFLKIENLFPKNENNIENKNNSRVHLNTDTYSVSSQKKRTQQELIRKTRANFTSEENAENTKMSSILVKKFKENISRINHINNNNKEKFV